MALQDSTPFLILSMDQAEKRTVIIRMRNQMAFCYWILKPCWAVQAFLFWFLERMDGGTYSPAASDTHLQLRLSIFEKKAKHRKKIFLRLNSDPLKVSFVFWSVMDCQFKGITGLLKDLDRKF